MSTTSRTPWRWSIPLGMAIGVLTVIFQSWLRNVSQVRTLPERVMEWILLFVPLDVFEAGLRQFGTDAKNIALTSGTGAMALTLAVVAVIAIRWRWNLPRLAIVALLLWLFATMIVIPVTGGGLLGSETFQGPLVVGLVYAVLALGFTTLVALAIAIVPSPAPIPTRPAERRAFLAVGAAALVSAAGVLVASRLPAGTASTLPAASLADLPAIPAATPPVGTAPTVTPSPATVAAALPRPAASVRLERGPDGVLAGAKRQPGTLADVITPNESFYVVTKNAGGDPRLEPDQWRLVIDGEVNRPVQLDYRTLRQLPSVDVGKTLNCISNLTANCEEAAFGCDLISTAVWRGVRLGDVLALAGGLKSGAVMLSATSADEFNSAVPLEMALDPDAIVAYEMNGAVLPYEHGYPARLLAPGRYGLKSAKWLVGIRAVNQRVVDWYGMRNWNRDALVQAWSRIDVPANNSSVNPGPARLAGIAYAGDRGVQAVDISIDGGSTWLPASFLEPAPGKDAWVRWQRQVDLAAGASYRITVRNRDGRGQLSAREFGLPQPDGGTGWHTIQVRSAPA